MTEGVYPLSALRATVSRTVGISGAFGHRSRGVMRSLFSRRTNSALCCSYKMHRSSLKGDSLGREFYSQSPQRDGEEEEKEFFTIKISGIILSAFNND